MPTTGPNFPSTTTGNTATVGGGTRAWTNPNNANAADSVFATCSFLAANATSNDLNAQGFGFSIAGTDTINGITVEINGKDSSALGTDNHAKLLKAGAAIGTDLSTGSWLLNVIATTFTYGGVANLWGTTWTPADINNAAFGFVWTGTNNGNIDGISIDFIRITITSTSAAGGTNTARMLIMF